MAANGRIVSKQSGHTDTDTYLLLNLVQLKSTLGSEIDNILMAITALKGGKDTQTFGNVPTLCLCSLTMKH